MYYQQKKTITVDFAYNRRNIYWIIRQFYWYLYALDDNNFAPDRIRPQNIRRETQSLTTILVTLTMIYVHNKYHKYQDNRLWAICQKWINETLLIPDKFSSPHQSKSEHRLHGPSDCVLVSSCVLDDIYQR